MLTYFFLSTSQTIIIAVEEIIPSIFVVPANNQKGYGFSHLIMHARGNILLPRLKTTSLSDSFDDIAAKGGVRNVLISDRHFGGPGCREAADHFGAAIYASQIEAEVIAGKCRVDKPLAFEQQLIDGYIEAIPTPGHQPGQFSYIIEVNRQRFLFTGDFIYRSGGAWIPGNRSLAMMQRSFDTLRGLKFDFVVGCADYDEPKSFVPVGGAVNAIVDEMQASCSSN